MTSTSAEIRLRDEMMMGAGFLALVFIFAGCARWPEKLAESHKASAPGAIQLARESLDAMGGARAWLDTGYMRFTFVVDAPGREPSKIHHWWDRRTGRYRVEYMDGPAKITALLNINTREGRAWRNNETLQGADLSGVLQKAYGRYINDTYWLLAPSKLLDPGVVLSDEGTGLGPDGKTEYRVIHASFRDVGLTPKDNYWFYVNPKTKIVEHWKFILKGGAGPASGYSWEDWRKVGPLLMCETHRQEGGERAIRFEDLEAASRVPDEMIFTAP